MSRSAVIVWSTLGVSLIDPHTDRRTANSLADLVRSEGLSSAVVLVAHRNALIRVTKVPNLPRTKLDPLIRAKINSLFPTGAQSYSFGYRVGSDSNGQGKLAILGGVKSESLRRIYLEADACGLKLVGVLPAAFAAWIAATEKHLSNAIVVSQQGDDTCFDVVTDSELVYSRFTRLGSESELGQEIQTTLQTVGLSEAPILCLGGLQLPGAISDRRELPLFAADPGVIQRSLFSLELEEIRVKRDRRRILVAAQRAVAITILACIGWGAVLVRHQSLTREQMERTKVASAIDRGESIKVSEALKESNQLTASAHLINLAFDPPQTFGDMISVLADDAGPGMWLTGLSVQRGGTLSIRGQAKEPKSISSYVEKLRGEPRFRNVQLKFSTKGERNNKPIYQFSVTAWAIGNLPFDQHLEKPKN